MQGSGGRVGRGGVGGAATESGRVKAGSRDWAAADQNCSTHVSLLATQSRQTSTSSGDQQTPATLCRCQHLHLDRTFTPFPLTPTLFRTRFHAVPTHALHHTHMHTRHAVYFHFTLNMKM